MSSPVLAATVTDLDGDKIDVCHWDGLVVLRAVSPEAVVEVHLDAALRDEFIRAYMTAERSAEAHGEADGE